MKATLGHKGAKLPQLLGWVLRDCVFQFIFFNPKSFTAHPPCARYHPDCCVRGNKRRAHLAELRFQCSEGEMQIVMDLKFIFCLPPPKKNLHAC